MLANVLGPFVKLFAPATAAPDDLQAQWRKTILNAPVGKFVYVGTSGNGMPLQTASNAPSAKTVRPSACVALNNLAKTIRDQQPDKGSKKAAQAQELSDHLCSLLRHDIRDGKNFRAHLQVTPELQEAVKNAL